MSEYKGGRARSRAVLPLLMMVVSALTVAGCGGGSESSSEGTQASPSKEEAAKPVSDKSPLPVVDLTVSSSAMKPSANGGIFLSDSFVCKKGNFPPVRWKGAPPKTKEVVVLFMKALPVQGKIYFNGAVAGLDPKAGGMPSGKLPKSAVVGENSEGESTFSVCPRGPEEELVLAVLASEKALRPEKGFDAAALRQEAYAASGHMGLLLFAARGHES